jgi:environmental stress-induced protein Ves
MPIHLFERAQLRATPWKNGGGVTREIACHPPQAGMQNFDWRISIAHIASDGDFSVFAGVDRVITLLEGGGVQLSRSAWPFAERGLPRLECDGAPRRVPGRGARVAAS